jgi:hypothetical protein
MRKWYRGSSNGHQGWLMVASHDYQEAVLEGPEVSFVDARIPASR